MPTYDIEKESDAVEREARPATPAQYRITNFKTVKDRQGNDVEVKETERTVSIPQIESEIANNLTRIAELEATNVELEAKKTAIEAI